MKNRKWRINWKKVERNLFILLNVVLIGAVIYTVKTKGISFFSTIRLF